MNGSCGNLTDLKGERWVIRVTSLFVVRIVLSSEDKERVSSPPPPPLTKRMSWGPSFWTIAATKSESTPRTSVHNKFMWISHGFSSSSRGTGVRGNSRGRVGAGWAGVGVVGVGVGGASTSNREFHKLERNLSIPPFSFQNFESLALARTAPYVFKSGLILFFFPVRGFILEERVGLVDEFLGDSSCDHHVFRAP